MKLCLKLCLADLCLCSTSLRVLGGPELLLPSEAPVEICRDLSRSVEICRSVEIEIYLWSAKPTQPTCDIEISVLFLCKRRLDVKWKPCWSACNKVVALMFFVMSRCRRLTTTTVCTNICSTGIISNYMNTNLYNNILFKYTGHFACSVWWTMWPSQAFCRACTSAHFSSNLFASHACDVHDVGPTSQSPTCLTQQSP